VARFCLGRFRSFWAALAADPFVEFLLFWVFANLIWTAIVPAKAPRYWLPLFPPVFLLAAHVLCRRLTGAAAATGRRHLDTAWRWIYGVIGAVGVIALVAGVVVAISPQLTLGRTSLSPAWAWLVMGTGWIAVAVLEFSRRVAWSTTARCLGLIVVVLAFKPVLSEVWWPMRAASDSQRANAATIDSLVPTGEPVFVLGSKELPDVAFYSRRRFQWLDDPGEARMYTGAAAIHCLLRVEELSEWVTGLGYDYEHQFDFVRADKPLTLIRIEPNQVNRSG
jgi:hypothetical protein